MRIAKEPNLKEPTLDQLENQKTETLTQLAAWSPARLAYRPEPAEWSATQVLDHIVKTESSIIALTRHNLPKPHRIHLRDRAGVALIDRIFQSDRKVKVPPSASRILPDPDITLEAVVQSWNTARGDLASLLAEATPDQREGGVFRHPIGGWMNLPQVLRFFFVHVQHHGFQLARLRTASAGM